MKYVVNSNCIGCGMCTGICGTVFSLNDEGFSQAIDGDIPAECEEDAAEAKDSCPVEAIEEA